MFYTEVVAAIGYVDLPGKGPLAPYLKRTGNSNSNMSHSKI